MLLGVILDSNVVWNVSTGWACCKGELVESMPLVLAHDVVASVGRHCRDLWLGIRSNKGIATRSEKATRGSWPYY